MSHDRFDDTAYNREKYKPMLSVIDGKNKGVGHKRRRLRKSCETDDEEDAEENHEVFERLTKNNNGKKQSAKVSEDKKR